MTARTLNLLIDHPLIPVVEIEDAAHGPMLADALVAGGIKCIEVTLRTEAALEAAELIIRNTAILVGLGTVLEADQLRFAKQIGAKFAVSPGLSEDLVATAEQEKIPYLPGVYTASEAMRARDLYCEVVKFFPAFLAPGVSAFKNISAILPNVKFCLTGGINQDSFSDVLKMKNVIAVGGSWIASREDIRKADWAGITNRAKRASEVLAALKASGAAV